VAEIDKSGAEAFIKDALQKLDGGNPELLQMAHYFASAQDNYLEVMQGFALLYTALLMQSEADSQSVH
jgi:acyl carrier protein phosphodiesterase